MKPAKPHPSLLWGAGIILLACAVFALATMARISRYCPQQSHVPHLSSSVKMSENRVDLADAVTLPCAIQVFRNDEPVHITPSFREALRPKPFLLERPFEFRPPPSLA